MSAKIIVVNASPNAPDYRLCIGSGTVSDGSDLVVGPLPPLPHDDSNLPAAKAYPGFYAGAGEALPQLTDYETKAITLFLIHVPNAKIAADVRSNVAERTCDTLIGANGQGGTGTNTLVKNVDYVQLQTIAVGTFIKRHTYVLAVTGCVAGNFSPTASQQCGATYDAASGNLGLRIVQLDRFVADTTKLGLQVLHLAQPIDGYVGAMFDGGVASFTGLGRDDLDGAAPPNGPVGNGISYGVFAPASGVAAAQTYAATDYDHTLAYETVFGYTPADADAGPDAAPIATMVSTSSFSFRDVQLLTYGEFDGGIGIGPAGQRLYTPNANFTLILLGDPTAQQRFADGGLNPLYDGHGIHFVMFPNDPPLPPL